MIMIRKIVLYFLIFTAPLIVWGCDDDQYIPVAKPVNGYAENVMNDLWNTSPITKDNSARQVLYDSIQAYSDNTPASMFSRYLVASDVTASSMEKYEPAYTCYKKAFDKVLAELQGTHVAEGQAVVWLLYNMGYVVKTPTVAFGVDLAHRHAAKMAPYLDFICSTHKHQDHYNMALMDSMYAAGKPVVSNFYKPTADYEYCSTTAKDYEIKGIKINSFITDHNNTDLLNFVTVFQFDCGANTNHFNMVHVGDSNYKPEQFKLNATPDVFIPRYAVNALTENNIIGSVTNPKYVLLSHILELTHDGVANSRWTLDMGLARAASINCDNTYMPFWGDKLIWDGTTLK